MPGTEASYADQIDTITATIAISTSVSNEIDLSNHRMMTIFMPAPWDAANLTFQVATAPGGTYQDLYDDGGTEVNVVAAASRAIGVDLHAGPLASARFIKIRSGTTATPVTQTAARSIVLVIKR